jgi:hypothetical protein
MSTNQIYKPIFPSIIRGKHDVAWANRKPAEFFIKMFAKSHVYILDVEVKIDFEI